MVVREVGHMRSGSGIKALPDLPTLLPRAERRQEIVEREDSSDEEPTPRVRSQIRKRARRTTARVPRKQYAVESVVSDSAVSDAGSGYLHQLRYMPSIDDVDEHVVVRARRAKSPARRRVTGSLMPYDSISVRGANRSRRSSKLIEDFTAFPAPGKPRSKKPHRCSKGDKCRKHGKPAETKRRRSPEHGTIFIATTPSIADASALPRLSAFEALTRPGSMLAPSVLASSDVLGPIHGREVKLQEGTLKDVGRMDPLENVKQFLTLQHLQHLEERRASPPPVPTKSAEDLARAHLRGPTVPPTPPPTSSPPLVPRSDAMLPPTSSHGSTSSVSIPFLPASHLPPTPTASPPFRSMTPSLGLRTMGMERACPPDFNPTSPVSRMRSPSGMMRTTTPFSEADVPVYTSTPSINDRSQSQSAPPDMRYRRFPTPDRAQFSLPTTPLPLPARRATSAAQFRPQPLHMTSVDENAEWELVEEDEDGTKMAPSPPPQRTHSGWMKKRRTNWFRHEWPDYHFVLKGTRLGYAKHMEKEDGFIEMDNYSVACSTTASHKLSAAFKGAKFFGKKNIREGENGAYFFQLVPAAPEAGKSGIGKVHYFAVGSREERIDWMRELMLAKAIKQKKDGFEVEVNGQRV